jgi:hypothetical protein
VGKSTQKPRKARKDEEVVSTLPASTTDEHFVACSDCVRYVTVCGFPSSLVTSEYVARGKPEDRANQLREERVMELLTQSDFFRPEKKQTSAFGGLPVAGATEKGSPIGDDDNEEVRQATTRAKSPSQLPHTRFFRSVFYTLTCISHISEHRRHHLHTCCKMNLNNMI